MAEYQELTEVEPDPEVKAEFAQVAAVNEGSREQLIDKLEQHNATSPILSGGDIDAAWEDDAVGDESAGGSSPTPDQDVVEEIGEAFGITYHDNEPLHTAEKLEERDKDRWELNPASAEDFDG